MWAAQEALNLPSYSLLISAHVTAVIFNLLKKQLLMFGQCVIIEFLPEVQAHQTCI